MALEGLDDRDDLRELMATLDAMYHACEENLRTEMQYPAAFLGDIAECCERVGREITDDELRAQLDMLCHTELDGDPSETMVKRLAPTDKADDATRDYFAIMGGCCYQLSDTLLGLMREQHGPFPQQPRRMRRLHRHRGTPPHIHHRQRQRRRR